MGPPGRKRESPLQGSRHRAGVARALFRLYSRDGRRILHVLRLVEPVPGASCCSGCWRCHFRQWKPGVDGGAGKEARWTEVDRPAYVENVF